MGGFTDSPLLLLSHSIFSFVFNNLPSHRQLWLVCHCLPWIAVKTEAAFTPNASTCSSDVWQGAKLTPRLTVLTLFTPKARRPDGSAPFFHRLQWFRPFVCDSLPSTCVAKHIFKGKKKVSVIFTDIHKLEAAPLKCFMKKNITQIFEILKMNVPY